ncbi:hypothetical protein GX563_12760 [Candidatus Bathyarchaeota archaeon]|nr:hypothetical protein [Candidatus Bathyarchaeota archaeon]
MVSKRIKLTFILILLSALTIIAIPAKSQTTGNIIIGSDGSVTGTTAITQNSSTYTLTENTTGKITVEKSNIVIDGAGYAINGAGIDFPTSSAREELIYNVTIRNLIISTGRIFANGGGYHTFYNNYIYGLELWGTEYNNITHCTIASINLNYGGSHSTITENNIINGLTAFLASNVTVDRNYWRFYLTRYPNATEIGNTGIGNQPYVLESSTPVISPDYHPLMKPISIPLTGSITEFPTSTPAPTDNPSSIGTPTPARTPSPTSAASATSSPIETPSSTPYTIESPFPPLVAVLAVIIALTAAVLIARKRKIQRK